MKRANAQSQDTTLEVLGFLLTYRCLPLSSLLAVWHTCTRLRSVRAELESIDVSLEQAHYPPLRRKTRAEANALCRVLCDCLCPSTTRRLSVRQLCIDGPVFAELVRHFRGLTALDISLMRGITEESLSALRGLHLQSLCLTSFPKSWKDDDPSFTILSSNTIASVLCGCASLVDFELEDLELEEVSSDPAGADAILLGLMQSADSLTSINLHGSGQVASSLDPDPASWSVGFSAEAMGRLVSGCSQLRRLDLGGGCMGGSGALRALENHAAPRLRELCLSWVPGVTDQALAAAVQGCPGLALLNAHAASLDGDRPGPATLLALARSCPHLQHLDFRRCVFGEDAFRSLVRGCPILRHINLKLCFGLTNDTARARCWRGARTSRSSA